MASRTSRKSRKTRSSRGVLAVVVGVVVLAGIGWCSDSDDLGEGSMVGSDSPTTTVDATPTLAPPGEPAPEPAPGAPPESGPPPADDAAPVGSGGIDPLIAPARAALPELEVKGRAPRTGYDRDEFGTAWTDDVSVEFGRNGCDTRNDILTRDLTEITYRPDTDDCIVLTGVLDGPFTGERIEFERGQETSMEVQIDHVVALSDAWQKGAQQHSEQQRKDFANDPLNLLAVAGWANQQKGDGDTATWLPPQTGFRCSYVSRQILVKERYDLWVTPAERDAMERVLSGCA